MLISRYLGKKKGCFLYFSMTWENIINSIILESCIFKNAAFVLFFYFSLIQQVLLHNFLTMITGQVITGSWDKSLKCWDPRGASGQERTLVGTYPQPERVYSLSLVGNRLVVATAGRHVNVYDLRNMSQPEQRRESSLKYQTRCVRCYPNGTGKITLYS